MEIAVASGKGGTGKTTVAAALGQVLHDLGWKTILLDADVESPNAKVYLKPDLNEQAVVALPVPEIIPERCDGCGTCSRVCQFHALVFLQGRPVVFPELCHGCGSCGLVCDRGAIREKPFAIGTLRGGMTPAGIHFAEGELDIGRPLGVPVIGELKGWKSLPNAEWRVVDAPPGASCPVVESIRGADFVILVTEPTPFGLHDLKKAVSLAGELEIPAGVVINRDGIGDQHVERYCREMGLPILLRIPFEEEIGAGLARGLTLLEIRPAYRGHFQRMVEKIQDAADGEKSG